MKERLKWLASIYLIPLIFMVAFPLIKDVKLNDETLGVFGLMVSGFISGLMLEGVLLMLAASVAILSGKMDESLTQK